MKDLLTYLLAAALIQNLVLTTGFGSSMMMRIIRRPGDLLPFGLLLTTFSLLTTLIIHPLDGILGTGFWEKLFRPLIMVAITAALYILFSLLIRLRVRLSRRVGHLLGLAAFNNIVIGVALILNHRFAATLPVAIGFSVGSCLGFVLLSLVLTQAARRADHPAMPDAFRGLPATLLYMGILALALMGFSGSVSFV